MTHFNETKRILKTIENKLWRSKKDKGLVNSEVFFVLGFCTCNIFRYQCILIGHEPCTVKSTRFMFLLLVYQVTYTGFDYPYPKVVLEVHLRRRYYYYLVNLVVPCSLIAVMVLLSFVLPPEAGERISLGITVLMAMAIFQELTSEKLPVESKFTPLLGN